MGGATELVEMHQTSSPTCKRPKELEVIVSVCLGGFVSDFACNSGESLFFFLAVRDFGVSQVKQTYLEAENHPL